MPVVRAEIHCSVIQDIVQGNLDVKLQSQVEGFGKVETGASIGATQVFVRLESLITNHIRTCCNQMEEQLKKQRKG